MMIDNKYVPKQILYEALYFYWHILGNSELQKKYFKNKNLDNMETSEVEEVRVINSNLLHYTIGEAVNGKYVNFKVGKTSTDNLRLFVLDGRLNLHLFSTELGKKLTQQIKIDEYDSLTYVDGIETFLNDGTLTVFVPSGLHKNQGITI